MKNIFDKIKNEDFLSGEEIKYLFESMETIDFLDPLTKVIDIGDKDYFYVLTFTINLQTKNYAFHSQFLKRIEKGDVNIMNIELIVDKIKNSEKLTEKELKFLFRDNDLFVDEIEIDSDSFTDSYMIVFDIGNEEYYSIVYTFDLCDIYDFPPQVAKRVQPKEITVHSWEYV